MIDRELVTRKMLLISKDLEQVVRIASGSRDDFLADEMTQVLAERYLERIITRLIDINYHVLVESGEPPPPDYFQSFIRLAEIDVLPADFSRQIAAAAGLRNHLVHEYDVIDYDLLFDALQSSAADIPKYLSYIEDLLDRTG